METQKPQTQKDEDVLDFSLEDISLEEIDQEAAEDDQEVIELTELVERGEPIAAQKGTDPAVPSGEGQQDETGDFDLSAEDLAGIEGAFEGEVQKSPGLAKGSETAADADLDFLLKEAEAEPVEPERGLSDEEQDLDQLLKQMKAEGGEKKETDLVDDLLEELPEPELPEPIIEAAALPQVEEAAPEPPVIDLADVTEEPRTPPPVPDAEPGLAAISEEKLESVVTRTVQDTLERIVPGVVGETVQGAVDKAVSEVLSRVVQESVERVVPGVVGETVRSAVEKMVPEVLGRVIQDIHEKVAKEAMTSVAERVIGEAIESLKKSL